MKNVFNLTSHFRTLSTYSVVGIGTAIGYLMLYVILIAAVVIFLLIFVELTLLTN